jgi:hypothetical protein
MDKSTYYKRTSVDTVPLCLNGHLPENKNNFH